MERMAEQLKRLLGDGYWVRQQAPFRCDEFSEPEPDVSVVTGTREGYEDHPKKA